MISRMTATLTADALPAPALAVAGQRRVTSLDALRGFVMFTMIFVNDLGGDHVPAWLRHFRGKNGMTFVDMVFPAFLFIVGMSIPLAFGSRLARGEPPWKILLHVLLRTLSLLFIGILMVNSESAPSARRMGWSGTLWTASMYVSAILAFCTISPPRRITPGAEADRDKQSTAFRAATAAVRGVGFAGMLFLAFSYRSSSGGRIITLRPFSIHTEWYGILGLIGGAYFM